MNTYFIDLEHGTFKVNGELLNGYTFYYGLTKQDGAEIYYKDYDKLLADWNIYSKKSSILSIEVLKKIAGTKTTYFETYVAKILSYTNESNGITSNKVVVLFE